MNKINSSLLYQDILHTVFSFLPASEKTVDKVNKEWRQIKRESLSIYFEVQQLNQKWNYFSRSDQKRFIRYLTIQPNENCQKIAQTLSVFFSGSKHEYFIQSNSWELFQGRLQIPDLVNKVKTDPIWIQEDFNQYFKVLCKKFIFDCPSEFPINNYPLSVNEQKSIALQIARKELQYKSETQLLEFLLNMQTSSLSSKKFFTPLLALVLTDLNRLEDLQKLISEMDDLEKGECALAFAEREDTVKAKEFTERLSSHQKNLAYLLCAQIFASHGDVINAKLFAEAAGSRKDEAYLECARIFAECRSVIHAQEFATLLSYNRKDIVFSWCAKAFAEHGDTIKAEEFAEKAGKGKAEAYQMCAKAFAEHGDAIKAEEFAEKADKGKAEAYQMCAKAFAERGDILNAKKFTKSAGTSHTCALAFANRGNEIHAKFFADLLTGHAKEQAYQKCAEIFAKRGDEVNARLFANLLTGPANKLAYQRCAEILNKRGDLTKAKEFAIL